PRMMSITLPTRGPIEDLDWLRSFAARLAHHEADDLVQDTMLGAISHATEQPRSRPWLATVMRNRFRMDWRSASRRKARESAFHAGRDETVTPDIATHRLRALRVLVELLEALPAEDRQI